MPTTQTYEGSIKLPRLSDHLTGQAAIDGDLILTGSENLKSWTNSKTGTSLPSWRNRIRQGISATTPFSGSELSYSNQPTYQHVYGNLSENEAPLSARRSECQWSVTTSAPGSVVSNPVDQLAENMARTKFWKDINRTTSLFQGGVFLGELRQTLRMIKHPAQSLRRGIDGYLTTVKKGRRGTKAQKRSFLRRTWLEYSFGWSPLLNDLDDARNYLERRQEALYQELVRVSGHGTATIQTADSSATNNSGVLHIGWRLRSTRRTEVRYIGAVRSKASSSRLIDASALGLSPRAFVPTLWEILPWSFLIDYFTNIGDVLTAWSDQSVNLAWGNVSTRKFVSTEGYDIRANVPLYTFAHTYDDYTVPGSYRADRKTVVRASAISPIPEFQFKLPGFGIKWLNIAALTDARRKIRPF